jgi:CBS domain-containing protein
MGAGLGSILSAWLPGGSPQLWALVAMAATLGGTMRAPLTAVAFALGLTHDVNALLPAILSCAVAYGFTVIVMPRSILTEKIARRGRHVFREYGVDPLERHFVVEVMTREPIAIPADMPVSEVRARYFGMTQLHRAYPIVAGERFLCLLDRALLDAVPLARLGEPIASALDGTATAPVAAPAETCRSVALRLASSGLERMAVVADRNSRKLVGIVSRSDLIKPTGALHEEEVHRERSFGGAR